jgi:hypothetical protein
MTMILDEDPILIYSTAEQRQLDMDSASYWIMQP